ncbi:hypothetical protein PLANPX_1716 [Lacipirellula parvula]|uniref:Uncharacterized protein n=2 Tax=Lacipirellula parvula TaxID=2650471 RepID=A0A5K7X5T5_9BACT|nr:hypothetical protein PLANPX_1716 [Lacipirellula parvula]
MDSPEIIRDRKSKSARELLDGARNFDCLMLEQATQLGESLKLTEVALYVQRALRIYEMIDSDALEILPKQVSDNLAERLRFVFEICERCLQFNPQDSQPQAVRSQLLAESEQLFIQAWGDSHAILAVTARYQQVKMLESLNELVEAHSQRSNEMIESLEVKARDLSRETAKTLEEAASALNSARDAAAAAGVHFQANKFQEASIEHKRLAKDWLGVLIGLAFLLAGWAFFGAWAFKAMEYLTDTPLDAPQLIASKVLVFGVLSFSAIIASRSYFAHCHNTVVNLHRQNALQTYKAIVEATGDAASRDVVLKHAAACIFAPQSSGYSKESNGKPSSVNIIETIGSHLGAKQEF